MTKAQSPAFSVILKEVFTFLDAEKIPYFIIGGIAVGVLGDPRFTYDLDVDIFLDKTKLSQLLEHADKAGFRLDKKQATEDAACFGTFRMFKEEVQVDCIIASTPLEDSVLARSQKMELFDTTVSVPTAEDLILLKIIPGRPKDLMDAESIMLRHSNSLDKKYLEEWAKKICDEAEDFRIWRELQALLKKI
jgi:hypothetical protein